MSRPLHVLRPALLVLLVLLALPVVSAQGVTDANSAEACEQAEPIISDVGTNAEASPFEEFICTIAAALHIREPLNDSPTDNTSEWVVLGYGTLLLLAVLTWIIVLFARITPRRMLRLKPESKIAEVAGGQTATYALTLTNRRKRRPATIELSVSRPPKGWSASLSVDKELPSGFKELVGEGDALRVFLSARKNLAHKAHIVLAVRPPTGADPEEWAELDVIAVPFHKENPLTKKAKEVRVVTLVREGVAHTAIRDVRHNPEVFRPGDEVTTTVVIGNTGETDNEDVRIKLNVNGEDVDERETDVPAGGEEEVDFHWTAPEGKARVRVALA
ncbi:MAG: hypothetical protein KY455_13180 [Euryarchaeota archaeon]|nr:hypothetical protein [Euryarchaeota archaeon]